MNTKSSGLRKKMQFWESSFEPQSERPGQDAIVWAILYTVGVAVFTSGLFTKYVHFSQEQSFKVTCGPVDGPHKPAQFLQIGPIGHFIQWRLFAVASCIASARLPQTVGHSCNAVDWQLVSVTTQLLQLVIQVTCASEFIGRNRKGKKSIIR